MHISRLIKFALPYEMLYYVRQTESCEWPQIGYWEREQIVAALSQTAASNVEQRIVTLSVITVIFISKEFIIIMSACCKDIPVYTWSAF